MTRLTEQQRRKTMLTQEGWSLAHVAENDCDVAAEICRAQIDGHVNALASIQGLEATARVTYALSDRITGGLKDPTDYRELVAEPPQPFVFEVIPERGWHWYSYAWGCFHGACALAFIEFMRG